ncbi:hypothetical protein U9M48_027480 [Paspalum notatum var. saurae]|uniref:RING-type E3 ubiquitin transferase n=1 Tax=Paspalum notatum var. saurae TaxID=547442 RepID=A0AAQ3TUU7_PASNO
MLRVQQRSRLLAAGGRAAPDDEEIRACSVVLGSVVSLMLLCGVLSLVPGPFAVTKAFIMLGAAAIMLMAVLLSWLALTTPRIASMLAASHAPAVAVAAVQPPVAATAAAPVRLARRLCACGLADAAGVASLPAFPYEPARPAAATTTTEGGSVAEQPPRGSGVLCAVCLEDVRAGEMVRQLPACRHLFHVGCVDVWLRSHRTCPICRRELPPRKATAARPTAAAPEALPLPPYGRLDAIRILSRRTQRRAFSSSLHAPDASSSTRCYTVIQLIRPTETGTDMVRSLDL